MKKILTRVALAIGLTAMASSTFAQAAANYPARPIKIVVPFAPGGTTDMLARLVGQRLTQSWGQPVVIENKPGAGATLGADIVAKSAPDGYTLVMGAAHHTIAQQVYAKIPYHFDRDFAPITMVAMVPNMVVVNSEVPAKNIAEFIALAKTQPGKLNYGSAGAGTAHHLIGEMFKLRAGVDLVHVPYKGSAPAVADLLSGQVQLMFDTVTSGLPQVKAGKLRALAVTTAKRSLAVPDLSTVAEAGVPGYDISTWYGLWGPKGLSKEVTDKLANEVARILKLPDVKERYAALGAEPVGNSPEEFAAYCKSELLKWAKVVKDSGAKAD